MRLAGAIVRTSSVYEKAPLTLALLSTLRAQRHPKTNTPKPDARDLPAWRYTSAPLQALCLNRALRKFGEPFAFSLNLSDNVIRAALADTRRGFACHMQDRLRRHLERALGHDVALWLLVELAPSGKLHLHGGVALAPGEADRAMEALSRAGGAWSNPNSARDYQTDLKPQWHADGWAGYPLKSLKATRAIVGDKLIARSRGLNAVAEAHYRTLRAILTGSAKNKIGAPGGTPSSTVAEPSAAPASPEDCANGERSTLTEQSEIAKSPGLLKSADATHPLSAQRAERCMYQRGLTNDDLQVWGDIHDDLCVMGRVDTGALLVTTGVHPALGSVVALQDAAGVILHCQNQPEIILNRNECPHAEVVVSFCDRRLSRGL